MKRRRFLSLEEYASRRSGPPDHAFAIAEFTYPGSGYVGGGTCRAV